MKLQESKFESQVLGVEKEMMFSIESENSVIFDILRDKMYSNKIAAVCREVASNGRDANRESGRSDINTIISIREPNVYVSVSGMSITFEDQGNGITPSRMEDIFLKYGASTKRDSNTQTGGFGLGAKTPFAYKDTFTVITVCDVDGKRIEYTYNAMIDSSRKGKMILFDTEDASTKETGTKIIVPIDSSDRYAFEEECYRATSLWDIKPEYIGFNTEAPIMNVVDSNSDISIVNIDSGSMENSSHILSIDGIPYPVEDLSSALGMDYDDVTTIKGRSIVLSFKTGELTIAANRETVQYDKETIALIKSRIEGVSDLVTVSIDSLFTEISALSFIDANILYRDYMKGTKNTWSACLESISTELKYFSESSRELYCYISSSWIKIQKSLGKRFLINNIIFRHHKVVKISENHHNRPSSKSREVDYIDIREIKTLDCIYIIKRGQRMDGRKNRTLFDKHEGSFYCIIEADDYSINQAIDELDELTYLVGVDMKFYRDVERAQLEKLPSGNIRKSKYEIKHLPYRIFDRDDRDGLTHNTNHVIYDPAIGGLMLDVDIEKVCFITVKRLGDLSYSDAITSRNLGEMRFLRDSRGINTIVVAEKVFDRYFSDYRTLSLERVLHEEAMKLVSEIEENWRAISGSIFRDKVKFSDFSFIIDSLPKLVKESIVESKKESYSYDLELLDSITGSRFNDRLKAGMDSIDKWTDDNIMTISYLDCNSFALRYRSSGDSVKSIIQRAKRSFKTESLSDRPVRNLKMINRFKNKPVR